MDTLKEHLRRAGKIGGQNNTPAQQEARALNLAKARLKLQKKRNENKSSAPIDTEHVHS